MSINARIVLTSKEETATQINLKFNAMYKEGENSWAYYTPSMNLSMTIRKEVGDEFEVGATYSLDFNKVPSDPPVDNVPPFHVPSHS